MFCNFSTIILIGSNLILSFAFNQFHNRLSIRNTLKQSTIEFNEIDTDSAAVTIEYNGVVFYREQENKPLQKSLLFLPGLDGAGNYSSLSLSNLTDYNVWRMIVPPSDRSRFIDLAIIVAKFMNENLMSVGDAPVLVGESFGGLLACYLATNTVSNIDISKLVLINPASSFDQTRWGTLAPLIASTGSAFPVVGMTTLLATSVELDQIQRISRSVISKINSTESALTELNKLYQSSKMITNALTPAILNWRITQWMTTGNCVMKNKFNKIKTPTLVIVGANDRLLPSKQEGRRLINVMNNTKVEVLEFLNSGHAILDGHINLNTILKKSKTFNTPITSETQQQIIQETDFNVPLPSEIDMQNIEKQFGPLIKALSPIFLSRVTDPDTGISRVVQGISSIPTAQEIGRPVLLVGNHQLLGADTGLIVKEFIDEKRVLIRGLAHPLIFAGPEVFGGGNRPTSVDYEGNIIKQPERRRFRLPFPRRKNNNPPHDEDDTTTASSTNKEVGDDTSQGMTAMKTFFTKYGAVEVTPGNYFELLKKRNETILLFPGGVKEALHKKGEAYTLHWPEKMDFIRMAASFDAIIVPFSAIGIADSVEMLLDRDDLLKIPFLNTQLLKSNQMLPQARAMGDDVIISPLVVPKPTPSRNYFIFQEPYDTKNLNVYDKKACREAYNTIRTQVQDGLTYLQDFRSKDPYKDFIPRSMYELMNGGKQAPTAPLL